MLCKFRAAKSHFFFSCEMKFPWNRREVVADQGSTHSFAQSFYQSFVSEQKYDIGTKQHVPNRIPESCAKQQVCIDDLSEERGLLRFESNSEATSDGGAQKLGSDVSRNSESITTKVCSQIGRK